MPARLKYRLFAVDKVVLFQVLEQDERFIRQDPSLVHITYDSTGGFSVVSACRPELQDARIYLRGADETENDRVAGIGFPNEKDAEAYVKKVHAALKEWAAAWRGFQGTKAEKASYLNVIGMPETYEV